MNETMNRKLLSNKAAIRLSAAQLAGLGLGQVAYVRAMRPEELPERLQRELNAAPGRDVYALHQANGEPILIAETRDLAIAGAIEHELSPLDLH